MENININAFIDELSKVERVTNVKYLVDSYGRHDDRFNYVVKFTIICSSKLSQHNYSNIHVSYEFESESLYCYVDDVTSKDVLLDEFEKIRIYNGRLKILARNEKEARYNAGFLYHAAFSNTLGVGKFDKFGGYFFYLQNKYYFLEFGRMIHYENRIIRMNKELNEDLLNKIKVHNELLEEFEVIVKKLEKLHR